jgi:hypothetical protein
LPELYLLELFIAELLAIDSSQIVPNPQELAAISSPPLRPTGQSWMR